jgi:hypothetical protein
LLSPGHRHCLSGISCLRRTPLTAWTTPARHPVAVPGNGFAAHLGLETGTLPAPDGSGSLVVALDLHAHEAVVEHSRGSVERVPLAPDRPVATGEGTPSRIR